MAYTVPHTWTAGDFVRASWLNLYTTDVVDHEARLVTLEASGAGDVVGPSASIASEIALFDGTTGKLLKRATGTGYVKVTSGVMGTPAATVPLATDVSGNLPLANLPTNFAQIFLESFPLTNAQFLALPTTPITLISAPAAGKRIKVISAAIRVDKTAAYTNLNATYCALALYWLGDFSQWAASGVVNDSGASVARLTTLITGTGIHLCDVGPYTENFSSNWNVPSVFATSVAEAKALAIAADNNGSGNFTGGNAANSARVDVLYAVI